MKRLASSNSSGLRIVLGLVLLTLVCLGICAVVVFIRCERARMPPDTPVYPDSVLVGQESIGTDRWPLITYQYTSTHLPERIVAYYEERGRCREYEERERIVCQGEATPFGEYFVYIDLARYPVEGITPYILEVQWSGCTGELE